PSALAIPWSPLTFDTGASTGNAIIECAASSDTTIEIESRVRNAGSNLASIHNAHPVNRRDPATLNGRGYCHAGKESSQETRALQRQPSHTPTSKARCSISLGDGYLLICFHRGGWCASIARMQRPLQYSLQARSLLLQGDGLVDPSPLASRGH